MESRHLSEEINARRKLVQANTIEGVPNRCSQRHFQSLVLKVDFEIVRT